METKSDKEKELIIRYLSGTASEDEMEIVVNWLAIDKINKKYFADLKQIWIESKLALQPDDKKLDEAYNRLINRINALKLKVIDAGINKNRKIDWTIIYKSAAIILALFSIALSILYFSKNQVETPVISYNEIVIPYGSKSQLVLSDGTKIWLNSGSKLKYPDRFIGNERKVFLEGEGFFEVSPDKKAMFIVNASQVNVKVFGTKFNVKCFPDDKSIETALVSGSIELEKVDKAGNITESLKMKPSQIVTYLKESERFFISNQAIDEKKINKKGVQRITPLNPVQAKTIELVTSWKDNRLTFRSDSINVLVDKLQKWYNVSIKLEATELRKYTFTGTFTTETIEQALGYLKLTTPFNYKIDKNNITIYPNIKNN